MSEAEPESKIGPLQNGGLEEATMSLEDDDDPVQNPDYVNIEKEVTYNPFPAPIRDPEYMNVGAIQQGVQSFDNSADTQPFDKSVDTPVTVDNIDVKQREKETLFFRQDGSGGPRRIDYVLVYLDEEEDKKSEKHSEKRAVFQNNLQDEGIEIEIEDKSNSVDGKSVYVKLHATWDALCTGAELMSMKKRIRMPKELEDKLAACHCCDPFTVGEPVIQEEDDFFTAPFNTERIHMFEVEPSNVDSMNRFFSNAERSLILKEILDRTSFTPPESDETRFGISRLLRHGSYTAAFPLHEGPYKADPDDPSKFDGIDKDRQRLWEAWARPGRWCFYQPLDLIRSYFGEKIAIYFTWLGYYTSMLIPAAFLGLGVFIYGIVTLWDNAPSEDICDNNKMGNVTMCPQCDERCPYWKLHDSCIYARLTYIFDNYATVAFAVFMSVWATCFLEFWKRKQKEIEYEWDVAGFEFEERMRPEYEFKVKKRKENPITKVREPYLPWYSRIPRTCSAYVVVLFMTCLVVGTIFGIVVYRIVVVALLYTLPVDLVKEYAKIITSLTGAVCNLVIIIILNLIYRQCARLFTDMEQHRTETEYEDAYTFKMFLFQFVNFYGSVFYIAFFKGSFIDRPGTTNMYLFGRYRQDACDPAGCMVDLFIQIAIVMIGKQSLNNAKELLLPFIKTWCRRRGSKKGETDANLYMRWEQDKDLEVLPRLGLFEEYLEMVIQFGFVTIFVSAFPLAPLFALLNNVIEIRLDAYKFLTIWQRSPALRAQDIGIWTDILTGLSFLAVLSNAFIIGWTSDFVPKLAYLVRHDSLHGYIDNSLSHLNISDLLIPPNNPQIDVTDNVCRYKGWREPFDAKPPLIPYDFTRQYWEVFAARLAFVIVFEHVCFLITWILSYMIPDVPMHVKQLQLYEKQLTKKLNFDHTFEAMKQRRTMIRSALVQNSLEF